MTAQATAQIGVTGLGVMGRNLARNFARHGYATALHNRTTARTDAIVEEFGHEGTFVPAHTAEEFVASLERPRRLVIMVKAGAATDAVIEEFAPLLEPGDMIIDGGNAHFDDTRRREAALRERGHPLRRHGRLRRRGGRAQRPVDHARRLGGVVRSRSARMLEAIAAKVDGAPVRDAHRPGRRRALREDGAQRHRVRRHAADRRGVRPAPARRRATSPRRSPRSSGPGTPAASTPTSSRSPPRSSRTPTRRPASPFVDIVLDQAEQKGTGRWTVQIALDLGVPVSGIAEAVFARVAVRPRRPARRRPRAAGPGPRHDGGGPRHVRRQGRAGAVRVEDRLLRPGLEHDRRGQRRVRLGHRPRRRWRSSGAAAASSGPRSSTGSAPRTQASPQLPTPAVRPGLRRGDRATPRTPGARWSPPRCSSGIPVPGLLRRARLLRRAARRAAARRARSRGSATSSARTPTGAPTARAASTRCGRRTARKSAGKPRDEPRARKADIYGRDHALRSLSPADG